MGRSRGAKGGGKRVPEIKYIAYPEATRQDTHDATLTSEEDKDTRFMLPSGR